MMATTLTVDGLLQHLRPRDPTRLVYQRKQGLRLYPFRDADT